MDTPLQPVKIIIDNFLENEKSGSNPQFPKNELYENFLDHHKDQLSKYKEDDRLVYLFNSITKTEDYIDSLSSTINRKASEINIDIIRGLIEEFMNKHMEAIDKDTFNYYPSIQDAEFNKKISSKIEFQKTKLPLILKNTNQSKNFRLSNAQRFAKNFISESTPYNGILLWHEVGVGKTCAGISIAENFRSKMHANSKKIIILTPSETLQQNWTDEIFNIEKELNNRKSAEPVNVQCTGNSYSSKFSHVTEDNFIQLKRQSKKYINQFYQLLSYNKLAKLVELKIKQQSWNKINKQKAIIDYIRNEFSNRLIIMDEVHVTRESDESSTHKMAVQYIELIARYAENTKIVLLTATPMYNISSEIVWLMNILLLNDKRAPLRESDIFERDGIRLKLDDRSSEQTSLDILIKKTRGYISYVRGSNPINFPIRLDPKTDTYIPNPTKEVVAGTTQPIDERTLDVPIKNMNFSKNSMSKWQWEYIKRLILYKDLETMAPSGFSQVPIRASNIVFPRDGTKEGLHGDEGFDNCFDYDSSDNKLVMKEFAKKIKSNSSFLHISNLSKYSRKIRKIVSSSLTNKGIGFIFSQYLKSGTTIMALALEQNGFVRYLGNGEENNLLKPNLPMDERFCAKHLKHYKDLSPSEKENFIQARYILLDGSVSKPLLNQLIKECRGEGDNPNLEGEHIKIVIGSRVTEQGLSLHRVREVHIMDPWHHLNQMAQATGRAVRNKSHIKLHENKRNVTIYLHISALPNNIKQEDQGIETPDERIYRKAFNKKLNMSKVERLIKQNAVDCSFNKLGNIYLEEFYQDISPDLNPLKQQTIVDSKGERRSISLYDKNGDINCDFQNCDYNCFLNNNDDTPQELINNSDTNSYEFSAYDIEFAEEFILNMFKESFALYENEIIDSVLQQFHNSGSQDMNEDIIYIALNNIIKNKIPAKDIYGRSGYVINRNNIYIFQPFELENVHMPMLYRYIPNLTLPDKATIPKIYEQSRPAIRLKIPTSKKTSESDMEKIILNKWQEFKNHFNHKRVSYDVEKKAPVIKLLNNNETFIKNLYKIHIFTELETNTSTLTNLNWTSKERMILLKIIIEAKLMKQSLKQKDDKFNYEELIFSYYDNKPTKFILKAKDIPYESAHDIKGFRFITDDNNQHIFLHDIETNKLKDMKSSYADYLFKETDLDVNTYKQYGWIENTKTRGQQESTSKLFLFYDKRSSGEAPKGKRQEKRGGVCGAVEGARKINEMVKFLIELILENNELFKGFFEHSKTLEEKSLISEYLVKKSQADLDKNGICLEIQRILRYIDFFSPEIRKNNRLFYSYEERLLHNFFKKR